MKYQHLSVQEREKIQELWWERKSIRFIAQTIGRSPSSVSRELRRNFPAEHKVYTPRLAQIRAMAKRKSRGRKDRLKNERIRSYVTAHLKRRWSPEQIAHMIKLALGDNISHEAIYQFIYAPISYGKPRPGFEDLRPYLRRRRKLRQPKGLRRVQRLPRSNGLSIDQRPLIVEKRRRFGDWEGDSVVSVNHRPGINTLVDRKSGLTLITKLKGKTSKDTTEAVYSRLKKLPEKLRRTLTLDNGSENAGWRELQALTGVQCFYAHAYRSWERGTNENTNGLIRDYFPKKTDFTTISEEELAYVEHELNTRPRKRLNWKTPLEVISVALEG